MCARVREYVCLPPVSSTFTQDHLWMCSCTSDRSCCVYACFCCRNTWLNDAGRQLSGIGELDPNDAKTLHLVDSDHSSCCFDHGTCRDRKQWVSFKTSDRVQMLRVEPPFGQSIINGEGNIFAHTWRVCDFSSAWRRCPGPTGALAAEADCLKHSRTDRRDC